MANRQDDAAGRLIREETHEGIAAALVVVYVAQIGTPCQLIFNQGLTVPIPAGFSKSAAAGK
jgi:hypothetical protein